MVSAMLPRHPSHFQAALEHAGRAEKQAKCLMHNNIVWADLE